MQPDSFEERLRECVAPERVSRGAPLAPLTTFKVGGPADWLVTVTSLDELDSLASAAREHGVPLTVMGGGSNVLVGDLGIRGVVARLNLAGVDLAGAGSVRAQAGVTINGLVRWTIGRGLAGLEAWAGTPGTVGGAIYGNAHFNGRNIGDLVTEAMLLAPGGRRQVVARADLGFGYDTSRLKSTGEILVWAAFAAASGDTAALRATARASLAHRKRTQPLESPSAGCIFQNPVPGRDPLPDGVPASAGALIDRAGLKGERRGGAQISPTHANFFINNGGATARDLRQLIDLARVRVRDQFGVELRDEIVMMGEF